MQQASSAIPSWLQRALSYPYEALVSREHLSSEKGTLEELLSAAESAITLYRINDAHNIATIIAEHPQRGENKYRCYILGLTARLHLIGGSIKRALRSFQESLQCASEQNYSALAHLLWARTLDSIGDYPTALEHYRAALESVPPTDNFSITFIRCAIAGIECILGDYDGAKRILEGLHDRLNKGEQHFERTLLKTTEASIALAADAPEQALEQIMTVRSSVDRSANILLSLYHDLLLLEAYILLRRWDDAGSLGEALVTRTEELNLPYHKAVARYAYGRIFGSEDSSFYSPPLAIEQFKKALALLSIVPHCELAARVHLAIAETYRTIGHYQKAFFHLEQYTSHRNRIHAAAQQIIRAEVDIAVQNLSVEIGYHQTRTQQLEEMLTAANQQIELYRQRMDEQIAYLGVVAHDLKNPIAAIMMGASIIGRYGHKLSASDLEKHANNILQTADWMKELITSLLDFAALSTGKLKLTIEPVHTALLFDVVIEAYRLKALAKSLTIHKVYHHTDLYVLADSKRLQECLDNLLSNAIKYSPLGRNIYCGTEQLGDKVRLWVRDEGVGLTPEEQQRLFCEFSRARSYDTGSEGGTGLGLSIVRRFVEAMNGSIGCESEVGNGSTFYIELPFTSPPSAIARIHEHNPSIEQHAM